MLDEEQATNTQQEKVWRSIASKGHWHGTGSFPLSALTMTFADKHVVNDMFKLIALLTTICTLPKHGPHEREGAETNSLAATVTCQLRAEVGEEGNARDTSEFNLLRTVSM